MSCKNCYFGISPLNFFSEFLKLIMDSSLVKHQNDNSSQETVAGEYLSLVATREVNLDTQSFDTSAVEIKEVDIPFPGLIALAISILLKFQ